MENLDLSAFFVTKDQANDFISRLSTLSEAVYRTNFDLEKELMEQFGIRKKDKFIAFLRDNNIKTDSNSALKEFFTKIQEKVSALPTLSLTIAFEPKEQTLQAISEWFLLNINKQVLFDISVDSDLIAGANVTYNGKFLDLSIKTEFDRILNDILVKKIVTLPETSHVNIY